MLGFQNIEKAFNGKEAVEKVQKQSFKLVIMDMNMPVMSGIESAQKMRAFFTGSSDTKIVLLTGNDLSQQSFESNLFDAYIYKPLNSKSLTDILRKFNMLKQHRDHFYS